MAADGITTQLENDDSLQLTRHEVLLEGGIEAVDHIRGQVYLLDERLSTQVEAEVYQRIVDSQIEAAWGLLLAFIQVNPEATLEEIIIEQNRLMQNAEKPAKVAISDKRDAYLESQERVRNYMFFENGRLGPKGIQEEQIVADILTALLEFTTGNIDATADQIQSELLMLCAQRRAKIRIALSVAEMWTTLNPFSAEEVETVEAP